MAGVGGVSQPPGSCTCRQGWAWEAGARVLPQPCPYLSDLEGAPAPPPPRPGISFPLLTWQAGDKLLPTCYCHPTPPTPPLPARCSRQSRHLPSRPAAQTPMASEPVWGVRSQVPTAPGIWGPPSERGLGAGGRGLALTFMACTTASGFCPAEL